MITGVRPPQWLPAPLWTVFLTRIWHGSPKTSMSPHRWSAAVTSAQFWVAFWASSLWSLLWPSWPSHSSCGGTHWTLAARHVRDFTFLWPSSSWSSSSLHGRCFFAHPEQLCLASSSSAACYWHWSSSSLRPTGCSMECVCWSPERRTIGGLWDMQHLW